MTRALVGWTLVAACSSSTPVVAPPASPVPLAGTWQPITGLPVTARARVAADPSASVPPFEWRACASGRPGCELWLPPGDRNTRERIYPSGVEPVFEDARGIHFSYLRRDQQAKHTVAVVQQLHGEAEAAWWSPDGDGIVAATASRHGLATRVLMPDAVTPPHYLGAGDLAMAASTHVVPASLDTTAPWSQDLARGDGFLVVEAMGMSDVRAAAYELAGRAFVGGEANATALRDPLPVADGYIATTDEPAATIVHVDRSGVRRVLAAPAGKRVLQAHVDRAANDAVVWVEEPLDAVGPPTLLTTSGEVTSLASRGPLVVNGGVATYVVDGARARIVRLADGETWDLAHEPGLALIAPLWINAEAAWFLVSDVGPGERGANMTAGIIRLART